MKLPLFFPALIAAVTLTAPLAAEARDRGNHGGNYRGGHYRGGSHGNHGNHGSWGRGHGHNYHSHYGRPYYSGSRYYGSRYYGSSWFGSGYYGYPYYYGPSLGVSFYSSPSTVYRGRQVYSSYSDRLAVDVQRELRRRGYYRGSIDGDIGPGSRAAIRQYQADRGLSVTGRIDSRLLSSLGIS